MNAPGGETIADGRGDYLAEVGRLLWPPPCEVTIGTDGRGIGTASAEYVLIPDAERPRLLVPGGRRAAATAVMGFNSGRSPRARLLSRLLSTGLRSGAAQLVLRDRVRVRVADGADTIERHLEHVLGETDSGLRIGLHIGPARANRKPVAQVLDGRGRIVGFVKIGINQLTSELVRAEAAALRTLAGARLRTVRVPAIRHHARWLDHELLVVDPLPVWRRRTELSATRLNAAVREIAEVGGILRQPLSASDYWHGLRERAAALDAQPRAHALRAALDAIARRGGQVLSFGAWHGDFTRWNLAMSRDEVLVWDWERFATGVPVGFDAVHYRIQDAITIDGRRPGVAVREAVADARALLAPVVPERSVRSGAAELVVLLYLAEIAVRYLADRQDEAGAALGRVEEWLLPELTARANRLAVAAGGKETS